MSGYLNEAFKYAQRHSEDRKMAVPKRDFSHANTLGIALGRLGLGYDMRAKTPWAIEARQVDGREVATV